MSSLLVGVPVLGRPGNAAPLVESIAATSPEASILWLCSEYDEAQQEASAAAVRKGWDIFTVMPFAAGPGDFAKKHNIGCEAARDLDYDLYFAGADDLLFHPGWLEACLACLEANPAAGVIGTNDMANPSVKAGLHSTHSLVTRDYIEREGGYVGGRGKVFFEGYDHQYCNPPETPIWMADLTFKTIGAIRPGDRVIGWEYNATARPTVGAPRRNLCFSDVLAVSRRQSELVRVEMESGRMFLCTPDHRWLNAAWMPASAHDRQWVEPRVGRILLHVIDEPPPRIGGFEREYGWLAGLYDGEGSGIVIATQSDGNPQVVEEIVRLLRALDIPHTHSHDGGMNHFSLTGGRQAFLDYLLQVEPVRRRSLASHIVGYRRREQSRCERADIGGRRFGHRDRIVAVEKLSGSTHEVVSMTTTSGNYIAHGYASRNCEVELVQTAIARGRYAHCHAAKVEHMHPIFRRDVPMDDTYRRALAKGREDRALFKSRQHLWEAERAVV